MLVLAVKQDQVGEGFGGERRILEQEIKLFETCGWILLDIHQSRVVKGDWIKFIFVSRRHVHESFSCSGWVLHRVLNGSLKIEGLNKSGLLECLSITNTLNFNAF